MRWPSLLSIGLLAAGAALLVAAAVTGQGEVFFVLIVPVFTSRGPLAAVGLLLIFFAFLVGFFAMAAGASPAEKTAHQPTRGAAAKRSFGGVILVGPIPIVVGSSSKAALAAVIAAVLLLIVVTAFVLTLTGA